MDLVNLILLIIIVIIIFFIAIYLYLNLERIDQTHQDNNEDSECLSIIPFSVDHLTDPIK